MQISSTRVRATQNPAEEKGKMGFGIPNAKKVRGPSQPKKPLYARDSASSQLRVHTHGQKSFNDVLAAALTVKEVWMNKRSHSIRCIKVRLLAGHLHKPSRARRQERHWILWQVSEKKRLKKKKMWRGLAWLLYRILLSFIPRNCTKRAMSIAVITGGPFHIC